MVFNDLLKIQCQATKQKMRLQMSFWVHCSNTVPDFIHATALTSPGKPLISIKQPTNTFCTTISTINYI